jgi:hypothetical protein
MSRNSSIFVVIDDTQTSLDPNSKRNQYLLAHLFRRGLFAGLSTGRLGLNPKQVNVEFVVDEQKMRQIFYKDFGFPLPSSF